MMYSAVREPGFRSKVAVYSTRTNLEPIGACIGEKGSRIANIIKELHGEKIDVVRYSEDPKTFIENALAPAKNLTVLVTDEKERTAIVVADDDNYSLQDRICDHLAEGGREGEDFRYNERLFFSACGCDDSREAYDEEVKLFKIFFSDTGSRIVGNGYQDDIHSSRSIKNTNPCLPLLPCNVFVDNINRPAQPRE